MSLFGDTAAGQIRAVGPTHAGVLGALQRECFPAMPWTDAHACDWLALPTSHAWICADRTEPVGFVLLQAVADEAEIVLIGIIPSRQRGGLGARLLTAVSETMAAAGIHALFLEVEVTNEAALALYRQAGFADVGSRRDYYGPGRCALILRRCL